ncbi:Cleavage and polyadenylation specificity factor subunit like [Actinidia chinensis var. chinensis]|uniref:Cleavage and polyadenylation specificity factor subunit like n=1 Tax=Actinidia chinensis var. chinensis TaxID=1590841 RepID=A0A2R6REC5_ACTCC|nr:Cleavage and polyadenylation specificity factor subunit like [Actinidia chinensis var. chinensis]
MDPMAEEQLDYEDEEYVGAQKMQYQAAGAISALADDEMIGEDDEYDDLYNDVNVGEGFLQLQRSEAPVPSAGVGNGGFQVQKTSLPEPRSGAAGSQQASVHGVPIEGKYSNSGTHFPKPKEELALDKGQVVTTDIAQKVRVHGMTHDAQGGNLGIQGSYLMPLKIGVDSTEMSVKVVNESAPLVNSGTDGPTNAPQMPANQAGMNVNVNVNRPMAYENQFRPALENGETMLYVGELHWWTTDADLESVLSQYGRVKEIKFFDERASGKSKGYCHVEFYDAAAAAVCKEGMNGHAFNGRACIVTFASQQTVKQMPSSYMNKNQVQPQSQSQGRRPMNDGLGRDGVGRGGGMNQPGGDAGRNFGRGGWGRGGQGILNRGSGGGPMRGRGGPMGARNMVGNASGIGSGVGGGAYGQGLAGPAFVGPPGGLMHPQGMMGAGFDPTYMGRGAGYGGFSGPPFPGMLPSFPAVNAMGFAGVAPHVNPAFFGRGMAANGMGMMGSTGMDGHHAGMWSDMSMGGWGGEEHSRRTRESSYGGEDGASEYGYGETSHEKGVRSNAASQEKERGSERDWSGNSEKRHRGEREMERDRSDRDHRYREEKDGYQDHRQREHDTGYEDDWDRGQASSRSRSRSKAIPEEDHRRSRDADYGKRRRLPSE